jgi:transketolase
MNRPRIATRDAYGKTLIELGRENNKIVALDADLADSTRTGWFAKEFPERFIDVGVAEENLITVAAGLATAGKIPFASTFAVFATERAFNQIRQSVAYCNLNVKIVASHGGVSVGEDGASHHSILDIALMRIIPNMTVIVPSDAIETSLATRAVAERYGPVYLRTGRSPVPQIYDEDFSFEGKKLDYEVGKALTLKDGHDVAIIATGLMVSESLSAADQLAAEDIKARVIDMHTIKPLDIETVVRAAIDCGAIVTAEEHTILGGLGSAVAETSVSSTPVPIERVGVKDLFTLSGSPDVLFEKYGLSTQHIFEAAKRAYARKK